MLGKADKLVANRTLSALVFVCLILSAFAGVLVLSDSTPTRAQAIGDLNIVGTRYTIENLYQPVDGNVTVGAGGELYIKDATLSIISNDAPGLRHVITVSAGGKLILDHATITTYLDQITSWPFLTLTIDGSGTTMAATNNSVLMFPGDFVISNGADVSLHETTITALDSTNLVQYYAGGDPFLLDSADDGPAMSILGSAALSVFDSTIDALPEYPALDAYAENITLTGSSVLLAVDSYIGIDFGPAKTADDLYLHNILSLSGTSIAEIYGCYFEEFGGIPSDRAPAIDASGETYIAIPLTKGPEDTTGQVITALQASGEGSTYHVGPGLRMALDSFNAGTVGAIDAASLVVRYKADPTYNGNAGVTYSTNEVAQNPTGIVPQVSETSFVEKTFDLYAAGVTTTGVLSALDVNFIHTGTSGDIQFDSISIVISYGPEAHIYRWLNVTVGDEYGVPISGADISAVFTGSSSYGGQPLFYLGISGATPLPPDDVLDYMGETSSTFAVTKENGMAVVPFLTDLISGGQAPNSLFVGSFDVTGSTLAYSSTQAYSFPAYPAMTLADRSFDFAVSIEGISVVSPDISRWLVVPPDLDITDMTYYHSGDVIVAAGGTLSVLDTTFIFVQEYANQRTVYVDSTESSPARLLFENSDVQSAQPINIIVKGYATLEANFTNFQGVNIVALEHSRVVLRNVTMMGGSLTTSWDSWANISLFDTALNNPVVLSGYSRGYFTDTVLPSIDVEDDAEAWVYRWIYVTIHDGAGQPLPDAVVSAYRYADGKYMGYAISGDTTPFLGVARVNALATILTSESTQFVGNYRLNAVYSYGGSDYYGDQEISVGVMPYSEPLTWNATFASIDISSALPKLSVPVPVTVWPSSPVKNNLTYVNATVLNEGVTGAYNVEVYFLDDVTANPADPDPTVPFAIVVVPWIDPGEQVVVTARWLATYPVGEPHRMLVLVDPNKLIKEIGETDTTPPTEGEGFVTVQSLADFSVTQIYTTPSAVVVDVTCTINAVVHNGGDEPAANVDVEFWDGATYIDTYTVVFIEAGGDATAFVSYAFTIYSPPDSNVIVRANPAHTVVELDYTNNNASQFITVLEPPNLRLANMYFIPVDQVPGGDQVTVRATLSNLKPAPFSSPTVRLTVSYTLDGELHTASQDTVVPYVFTFEFGPVTVSMSFISPVVNTRTTLDVTMEVNPGQSPAESTYTDNTVTGAIDALDVRADLSIASQNIYVQSSGGNITGEEFGRVVTINALIDNLGGRPVTNFQVQLGWNNSAGYNRTLLVYPFANISAVAGNHTTLITFSWMINITTPGLISIWVLVDAPDSIDEPDENNNFAANAFTINELDMNIAISTAAQEYGIGDSIVVTVTFTYTGSNVPVKGLPGVQLSLYNTATRTVAPGSATGLLWTNNETGKVSVSLIVPSTIESGTYKVQVEVTSTGDIERSDTDLQITGAVEGGMFPWWFWIVIIIVAAAGVGGAFIYTYVYGLGKLVECGECGAFISAAEKRCPKCGVEFEVGTMKCSECGAWIPAESAECPNCGVKFVGEVEEEKDYLERMRKEYEDMVSKYRELAKVELGKKFSEKNFQEWWTRQPAFISFEDWLAKEEEKKKEGPVPCPVCGTLNPKEATVCHKCGTVFGAPRPAGGPSKKGPPPAAPPAAGGQQEPAEAEGQEEMPPTQAAAPAAGAPRMVIRRPIDRKVIPKKIIKTPTGEERTEGEENQ